VNDFVRHGRLQRGSFEELTTHSLFINPIL
jgi:hypothetical protein